MPDDGRAMVLAASLTTVVTVLNGGRDFLLIGSLLAAELIGFFVVMPALRPAEMVDQKDATNPNAGGGDRTRSKVLM